MQNVTREAVEILATEQGKTVLVMLTELQASAAALSTVLVMLTELQASAAALSDDATLEALCCIKSEVLGL